MNTSKKTFIVIIIILILIIICFLGKYFYKYYIITKFQEKIAEIEKSGNYKFEYGDITVYVKDNIYVQSFFDTSYVVINKNTDEILILNENGIQQTDNIASITVANIFLIDGLNNEISLFNIKNNLIYSELLEAEFDGKNCYKLTYETETMPNRFTVYFEKETYLPVGFYYENEDITYVQIDENVVTNEDISEDAIMEKIMEALD